MWGTAAAARLATRITKNGATIAASLIAFGTIERGRIRINLDPGAMADRLGISTEVLHEDLITIDSAFSCKRRGVELKIIAGDRIPQADCREGDSLVVTKLDRLAR